MPAPDLASHCPAPQTLAEFHAGALPDTDLEAVAAHLSGCPACESALSQLERSSLEGGLTDRIRKCLVLPAAAGPAYAPTLAGPDAEPTGWFEGLGGSSGPLLGLLDRADADAPAADRVLGPYQVFERLGGGGMGVVFRAKHRVLNRPTALKVIRADKLDSPGARPRFQAEAEAVASLEHPNIVRLFDFGEADGQLYFGMELVPGGSLAARLTNGPLPPRVAVRLVRDVARAMAHAHRHGVIHRDLKPANILLQGAEGGRRGVTPRPPAAPALFPKVADFGLAKWVGVGDDTGDPGDSSAAAQTTAGQVLGTPAYMAVEQAEGRVDDIGPHSDVWSLGVILYECLTRRLPFEGPDKSAVLELVRECEPVRPSVRMPGISPDLEAICLKCLERDTWCRYPDADTLADDLDRWLRDDPVSARTPTRRETVARWVRKHARRVAVAATLLVAVGGAAAGGAVVPWNKPAAPTLRAWERPGTLPAASPDPDKARAALAAKLAGPGPVELVPEKGPPAYYRVLGTVPARFDTAPDGAFQITGGPVCLVELAPAAGRDRYRVRAQVRHESGLGGAKVGVYFALQSAAGTDGPHFLYGLALFNDVVSYRKVAVERLGDRLKPNQIARNHLNVGVEHLRFVPPDPDGRRAESGIGTSGLASGEGYDPPENRTTWRDLEVTVTPAGVVAKLDGMTAAEAAAGKVTAACEERLKYVARQHPDDPAVTAIRPTFTPAGGVGLIVRGGTASVRALVLDSLPPNH